MAFWIFKCSPEQYRLSQRLADPNPATSWRVTKYRDEMGLATRSSFGKPAPTVAFVRSCAWMKRRANSPSWRLSNHTTSSATQKRSYVSWARLRAVTSICHTESSATSPAWKTFLCSVKMFTSRRPTFRLLLEEGVILSRLIEGEDA